MIKKLVFTALVWSSLAITAFCQFPRLSVNIDKKVQELKISSLEINIDVVGNISTTTFDVSFYNSFSRNLEAELDLPLAEGQQVSRYALEINGKLREGVVVEKVRGRQVFEAVVAQKIDPGIANLTKGNTFNTRIFPVPANGYKRVVIAITETLNGDEDNFYYTLPVAYDEKIAKFKLNVKVIADKQRINKKSMVFDNIDFDKGESAYLLEFERENYKPSKPIKFTIPRLSDSGYELYTGEFEGRTYFYLIAKTPDLPSADKAMPANIGIYWDNSFSSQKRDIQKEIQFIETYLADIPGTKKISVIPFNIRVADARTFNITNDASELTEYLLQLKNDGGTRIDKLDFGTSYDEILLFSDAVNTIASDDMPVSPIPVHSVTSAAGSNYSCLKRISAQSGGEFIDLNYISARDAAARLLMNETQFLPCTFDKREIEEVYPAVACAAGKYVEVTGKLKLSQPIITLNFGHSGKVESSIPVKISEAVNAPVERIWAQKKIEALQTYSAQTRDELTQLSTRFSIITPGTTFIVLDRLDDYITYGIEPPDELKDAYFERRSRMPKMGDNSQSVSSNLFNTQLDFNKLALWYGYNPAPAKTYGRIGSKPVTDTSQVLLDIEITDGLDLSEVEIMEYKVPLISKDKTSSGATVTSEEINSVQYIEGIRVSGVDSDRRQSRNRRSDNDNPGNVIQDEPSAPDRSTKDRKIEVLAWQPDAPYMSVLNDITDSIEMDSLYFIVKNDNLQRPSFYIEVSDLLFQKNMHAMAVRVLSNIIELDLENAELLKTAARRLLNEKESELAIEIYKEIRELRPEEPQSYRDLAMAYIQNGQYDKALSEYEYLLSHQWTKFSGINDILLVEFNHLVATHGDKLTINEKYKQFIKPMPADIRIVIDWCSNENDIDLWVFDPADEKCYYGHKNTNIGAKISTDFMVGYGPEEFILKDAIPGKYKVSVNYYNDRRQSITGPVTVYATMYMNYGKPDEVIKHFSVQLSRDKKTIEIGELIWEDKKGI